MSESPLPGQYSPEILKCIQKEERKRQYNKQYYQNKIKPKKEMDKSELELLRERCSLLEKQSQTHEDYLKLAERYNDLLDQFERMKEDNAALKMALEVSRQRNYELIMSKRDETQNKVQV
jgi:hypothetical protein